MKRIVVVLAAALAILVGAAVPAQADWDDCPNHGLCLYHHGWGEDAWYWAVVEGLSHGDCVALPNHRSNWAASAWNRAHGYRVRLYTSGSCGGTMVVELGENHYIREMGDWHWTISSYKILENA